MTQKQSLEGKVIIADTKNANFLSRRVRREVELVANDPDSIIKKLGENSINGVYAVVLTYPPKNNPGLRQYLKDLAKTIHETHSLGYDDAQLVVYSNASVEEVLRGTIIIPFRYEDGHSLIKYLNKSG
ncbi:hypothetical protein CMO94_00040 [Candidatus Woesearchaeota archaeon]|jgi:hypothetical protein|nr:hypothetical protein [Candidatus Woesearchaeota archaeon]|tara:strand:+ start:418 stop:801 length:384 start_codon:yes stop_codon:yes gene_type:complete